MKIGIIIDHISSLYLRKRLGNHPHEYVIYRNQSHQYSDHSNLGHHSATMRQGITYLLDQGADYIICPPVIELHYHQEYSQILPIFQQYLHHVLAYSKIGKIGFIGTTLQCELINLYRNNLVAQYSTSERQKKIRGFKNDFPLRTSIESHIHHLLQDHEPRHRVINHQIKNSLRPLKDSAIDTCVGLDYGYRASEKSFTHHCRGIKWHDTTKLSEIFAGLKIEKSDGYSVAIHYHGDVSSLIDNKKIWRMLSKGTQITPMLIQIKQ